jgi:hypothetical protein
MMRKSYLNIKSNYIKKKLTQSSWKNHKYIDDLVMLENFIMKGVKNFASGMAFSSLHVKYRRDYLAILKELKPDQHTHALLAEKIKKSLYLI